ncbi:hypothetical protein [Cohaesibacter celericrescens]|uniref:Uncharacterized protein n=1 Tax=Cohaesibacter celericrescens TaxID=2067669 RepID=A0A2N5XX75_9HYPH|nr:hypothetical protein [Cohaesibacter celericrescens]PLW79104.1 hypothetical protein C0081_02415 [Cohaesibacter celericrescens]
MNMKASNSPKTGSVTQPQIERAIKAAQCRGLDISEMLIEHKKVRLVFTGGQAHDVSNQQETATPPLKSWD